MTICYADASTIQHQIIMLFLQLTPTYKRNTTMLNSVFTIVIAIAAGWIASTIVIKNVLSNLKKVQEKVK